MAHTGSETRDVDLLLLDFGGVCLLNPVELHARAEAHLGLESGSLEWLGPVDPSTDELWRRMIAGELTERDYWAQRAAELGRTTGRQLTTRDYMDLLYTPPSDDLVRPGANRVVAAAQAAGYGVSVLTNDMRAFHGREWEHGIAFLGSIDHIVDCSDTDILKPDPRAFERAAEMTGVGFDRMLFVDDQPVNIAGAEALGIDSMWFDVSKADDAWLEIADRLRLDLGPSRRNPSDDL